MKKFLKVLLCLVVLAGIVVLCYFFATPGGTNLEMPTGKYYLTKVMTLEEEEESEQDFASSEFYLEVFEKKQIKSFSGEIGFVQDDKIYSYKVIGTGLQVFDKDNMIYEGYYVEEMIVIFISETFTNDEGEEEIKKTTEYRYEKRSENQ